MTEQPKQRPLRGVNLGGWLVLEKWLTPSLFKTTKAKDEYSYCKKATSKQMERLYEHRRTFITEADFQWLAQHGIEAVRLPIGYWALDDDDPYVGTAAYVDKAFEWANRHGLKVVLDLHAAPGSQNGKDHSGQAGETRWHTNQQHILKSLEVLLQLMYRYGSQPNLMGVELLNEPDPRIPRRILRKYYASAYHMIRNHTSDNVYVIFSDGFKPRRWKRTLRLPTYHNVCIDHHEYQIYSPKDKKTDVQGHLRQTFRKVTKQLAKMQRYHSVIIGEWSLALDPASTEGLTGEARQYAFQAYGAAQLLAYDSCHAWFYWNYKTESGGVWSFRDCTEKGLLPRFDQL